MSGLPKPITINYDFKHAQEYLRRVDTFLFDNDGTLCLNNEQNALDLIRDVCVDHLRKYHGIRYDDYNYHLYAGMPLKKICEEVGKRHGLPPLPESVEHEILKKRQQTPFHVEIVQVHPFMYGLVKACVSAGVHITVPTGGEADRAERYIRKAGLFPFFERQHRQGTQWIFYGKKPDPTCMFEAMNTHPEVLSGNRTPEPHRCVGIEDSLSGGKAVTAAGAYLLGHTLATHIPAERKPLLAKEMRQIGAAAVIENDAHAMDKLIHVLKLLPKRPGTVIDMAAHRSAKPDKARLPHDMFVQYQQGKCCVLPDGPQGGPG